MLTVYHWSNFLVPVIDQSLSMLVNHFIIYLHIYRIKIMEQIIENYPKHTYRGALVLSGLTTFFVRQEQLCNNLFNQIVGSDGQHKLLSLLPLFNTSSNYNTRFKKVFHVPRYNTNMYANSLSIRGASRVSSSL